MTTTTKTMQEAALDLAAQGFKVFPLIPRLKKPFKDSNGFEDASQLQSVIKEWWTKNPNANIGIRCDGLLVADFDGADGLKGLAKMESEHGKLPRTRVVKTGGGTVDDPHEQGLHYYYKVPTDLNIRPGTRKYGYDGFDIRANNSYAVAAPSITRLPYETIDDSPVVDAPEWLIGIALKPKKETITQSLGVAAGEPIPDGAQDEWLTSQAGVYRARGDDEAAIFEKLKIDILRCPQTQTQPYTEADFKRIAHSVCNYPAGQKKQETSEGSFITVDKKGNAVLDITKLTVAIMGKTTFAFMRDNDTGFYYENGVYKENAERLVAATCQRLVGITPILTEHKINEIIGHIRRSCYHDRKEFNPDPNIINVKNGLLNVLTCTLAPHTPDYLSNVQNPVEYNPATDCPAIKQFLTEIHEKEDISTMQELFGYLLLRDNRIQKAVLSVGGGENGKSTEQRVIQAFLGPENCAHKSWQQLENDRFASSGLEGKLVNLFADLPSNGVDTTTTFKMLTGGDAIDAERKFKDSYSFLSFAKLIFSTNKPPKVSNEDSYAFWRRWIIMEYPRQFTDKDKKPNILQELTTPEELSGLLNYALEGLKRLLTNNKFSYNKSVDEVTEYYMQAADPVYAFAVSSECDIRGDVVVLKDAFYDAFKEYCKKNKMPILAPNSFARSLVNQVGFHVRATRIKVKEERMPAWQGITLVNLDSQPKTPDNPPAPQQPTMAGMSPDESTPKTSEDGRDGRDGRDIPYFNILHAQAQAGAGSELTKIEKNPANPANPAKKPIRLENLDPCPTCGNDNIGVFDDGANGYYYCTDCYPEFSKQNFEEEEPNF